MKLIGSCASPFVRKIYVMLAEKGIPFESIQESPMAADSQAAQLNPLGKIPVLVTDKGEAMYESALLAEYVEQLQVAPAFLPAAPADSLHVRQVEALASGVTDAGIIIFREGMRPAEKQMEQVVAHQRKKIVNGMAALEQHAKDRRWLNGAEMTLADIATVCALSWLHFRGVIDDYHQTHPTLGELHDRLCRRESFLKTTPSAVS